ncbi:alpha/beta fold hydrolase [Ktedonospora formicarum]|uniref:Alpha/beta hydrolase n=1 Tax=Ktedonospora formicarum TaxID=2778364 RepID=A0A8J3IDU3_9CHLR|nr:alpha/beta hydrolase [Ktedonospora formicarum]GHO49494.1 alpha/beta hydrolase [Ktedonospora formicarum]
MSTSPLLLSGITQHTLQSERLKTAYLTTGQGPLPVVLIHGNCSSSLFFQDFMLALAETGRYTIYAPDLRGYGASETLPVDATRGVRDFSDDIASFVRALDLPSFHLLGWSLGGNVAIQYAIDYPGTLRTLMLEATGSPYGFGGTKDVIGTPVWLDYAGSGGGTANGDFVQRLADGDRGSDPTSPRTTINTFYFKPPFRAAPDREEIFVSSILAMAVAPGNYPGDTLPSENWPGSAPGAQGVNNALSPKYLNQGELANVSEKPPVLWFHGADDQIVSDTSMFDIGFLGQLGFVPGWPGAQLYPPQPMKGQIRAVLESYKEHGGTYQEFIIPECGHSPHIEQQDEAVKLCTEFIDAH